MREDREITAGGILPIGAAAPNFTARSTQGEISLSDFAGRWVILASHPGDFTPVCTSEFIALAKHREEFLERDCAVIALSVDSLYAHLAWLRAIYDRTGVKIEFPIVEDPTLAIAAAYGMVAEDSEDAATVRATFFIDPDGIIRASTYYPATVGRSVEEMMRILHALQQADETGMLVPEGWVPGGDVLQPPPVDSSTLYADEGEHWFFDWRQAEK